MRVTVVGIGQSLRGDDAAGTEAVHCWQQSNPHTAGRSDVGVQFAELPGLALLDMLDGFDAAVIVDAVQSSALPGTIHRLAPEDLAAFGSESRSAHGWGVAETLDLDRQLHDGRSRVRIRLIGIEAEQLKLGTPLSAPVKAALPSACLSIQAAVESLLSQSDAS
jgi:hydrogenase maturation protease